MPEDKIKDPEEGKEDPKPGEGEGEKKEEEKEEERALNLDILPEELRDKSDAEIKYILGKMADSAASGGAQIVELRTQLAALGDKIEEKKKEPDPDDDISDEELIQKDAAKAIDRILERKGVVGRFDTLEKRTDQATLALIGSQIEDFDDYRPDIEELLKLAGGDHSKESILGAYTMAVGRKVLLDRENEKKKAAGIDKTKSDPPKEDEEFVELTGLAKDVFLTSGMSRKEWEEHNTDDELPIEVPTS